MKRFLWSLLLLTSMLMLIACNNTDLVTVPDGTVSVTVGSSFEAGPNTGLGTQGVPYNPETGESGVDSAELRVVEGRVGDVLDFVEYMEEVFFDAEGNLVGREDAVTLTLSASEPSITLNLLPGDYGFVVDARPLAIGRVNTRVAEGDSVTVPLISFIGDLTLRGPEEVAPNEVFDVFLEISPPGRPDLRVPATDFTLKEFAVEGATILDESALGVRVVAGCKDIGVFARVFTKIASVDLDEYDYTQTTIPLSTSCANTAVGADFVPPFVSVTDLVEHDSGDGTFVLFGEVSDLQTGIDRVEVYSGAVFLGEAELDTKMTVHSWYKEIAPEDAQHPFIVLAYDNANNEGRAEYRETERTSLGSAASGDVMNLISDLVMPFYQTLLGR